MSILCAKLLPPVWFPHTPLWMLLRISPVFSPEMHLCSTFENPLLYNSPLRIVYRADLYLMRLASTASSGSMFSSKYFLSWYVQSPGLGQISAIMISSGSAVLGLVRCATGIALDLMLVVAEASLDKASAFSFSSRGI